jgi:hypothetical protein
LAVSENPTILSGEMSFTKGKSLFMAIEAANAVLPLPGGPFMLLLIVGYHVIKH